VKAGSNGCIHIILKEAKKCAKLRNMPNQHFRSSGLQKEAKTAKFGVLRAELATLPLAGPGDLVYNIADRCKRDC